MEDQQDLGAAKAGRILVVDDAQFTRTVLQRMLHGLGYETVAAATGVDALEALEPNIDLILLDVVMPEMSGFEVVTRIREGGYCDDIPIIMVTASGSMRDRLEAVEAGASDFICKPVEETELRVRVASQLKIKRAQDAARNYTHEVERVVVERTGKLEEANAKLSCLATTDALTGLSNHRALVLHLDDILEECAATSIPCGVLFIDIDHFKALNDSFGHLAGDAVLRGFAALLRETFGKSGACGRWGGEEFVVVLPGADAAFAARAAERLRRLVAECQFEEVQMSVTCSIGVAIYPLDGAERAAVAEAADRAMYVAKMLGRNQVRVASQVMDEYDALQKSTESREETALEGLVNALSTMIAARDPETGRLTAKVEQLAIRIGTVLDFSTHEMQFLRLVSRLHSIGKISIPDSILHKQEPLTESDIGILRNHPLVGASIVSHVPALRAIVRAIRGHNERWDGAGYPDGLVGNKIPAATRIVAVAEAYVSLTYGNDGRKTLDMEAALSELRTTDTGRFDPSMVAALGLTLRQDLVAA